MGAKLQFFRAEWSISGVIVGLVLVACGSNPAEPEREVGSTESASPGGPTTGQSTGAPSGGEGSPASTGTGGPTDSGMTSIDAPDLGEGFECDLFAQDCPPGQKCMPWANDGGTSWNDTRCSPIAEDPGEPGEPCQAEGGAFSGIDDCRLGAMCWEVDPETNTGTCVALCIGDVSDLTCEDQNSFCRTSEIDLLPVCLPLCDPQDQDCPEGKGCYPTSEAWVCLDDASGELGAYGDPCELIINTCDPGLVCIGAAGVPDCMGAAGCCSEICDISSDEGDAQCTGAPQGQICQAWYGETGAPPGFEYVGACTLPA